MPSSRPCVDGSGRTPGNDGGGNSDGAASDAGPVDFTPGQVPAEAPSWVAGLTPGVWAPKTNSLVTVEVELNNFGSYTRSTPAMFSLEHRQWRRGPDSAQQMPTFGWSAYDPGRKVI